MDRWIDVRTDEQAHTVGRSQTMTPLLRLICLVGAASQPACDYSGC